MSLGFALLAGVLSTQSPCVLLLPIVFGATVSEHRLGPAALAARLVFPFVAVDLFVATTGFSPGLDAAVFRSVGAVLLILTSITIFSGLDKALEVALVSASPRSLTDITTRF